MRITGNLAPVILFDRDGTLIEDVPVRHDDSPVTLMPGALAALDMARAAGARIGVVTNQPTVSEGEQSARRVTSVNAAVDRLAGPFDVWMVCPHARDAGCGCRKPQSGLVVGGARALGAPTSRVVVIGDVGSDVEAAKRAGAHAVLVPTPATRREEVEAAPVVASSLVEAVSAALAMLDHPAEDGAADMAKEEAACTSR